jgi:spore maturation protein CgeB
MKFVIFGLSVSSSWGNGHATLWRGLLAAMGNRGYRAAFFERDVPYYASQRDLSELTTGPLILYPDWNDVRHLAQEELRQADVAIVTSYCPDAIAAADLVADSPVKAKLFYDMDTGVTLDVVQAGRPVSYVGPNGFSQFDLVLSYTGGTALEELRECLGARRVAPLYGWVDPSIHRPTAARDEFHGDLSYFGTYSDDRQNTLARLLIQPARSLPHMRFVIGGAQYPHSFPWCENIFFVRHLPPSAHSAFYCSSRLTLNVTRPSMARRGYCPSGRIFEAAACGTAVLTDWWQGLDEFFEPGSEILVCNDTQNALDALQADPQFIDRITRRARERVLDQHTAAHRLAELESILDDFPSWPESARKTGTGEYSAPFSESDACPRFAERTSETWLSMTA